MSIMAPKDAVEKAKAVIMAEAEAVKALAAHFDENIWHVAKLLLQCKGHVLVTGAGTSAAVAERMAHLLSCCGTPALFINAANSLHGGAGAITAQDVVYIISKGGYSAEINQFADLARERGAKIIVQTENPQSPLAQKADLVYWVRTIGDVDPFGMIATGSSLVNAAAGDALCVLLLEMRGHTREAFGRTHPGGAVGKKLAEERIQGEAA